MYCRYVHCCGCDVMTAVRSSWTSQLVSQPAFRAPSLISVHQFQPAPAATATCPFTARFLDYSYLLASMIFNSLASAVQSAAQNDWYCSLCRKCHLAVQPDVGWLVTVEPDGMWFVTVEPDGMWIVTAEPDGIWLVTAERNEMWLVTGEPDGMWLVTAERDGMWLVTAERHKH